MITEEIAEQGRIAFWVNTRSDWRSLPADIRAWWKDAVLLVQRGQVAKPTPEWGAGTDQEWERFVKKVRELSLPKAVCCPKCGATEGRHNMIAFPNTTHSWYACPNGQLQPAENVDKLKAQIADLECERRLLEQSAAKSEKRSQERDEANQKLAVLTARVDNMSASLTDALNANRALNDNLTATQKRCTELIDETRALKRELAAYDVPNKSGAV